MACGVTVEVPLRDLLCDQCRRELHPIEQPYDTGTELFEASVSLPRKGDEEPVTVPIDVRMLNLKQDGPHSMRVQARIALPCSGCGIPHDLVHQLQASELFVRNLRQCPRGHRQDVRDLAIEWSEETEGPVAEVTCSVYCPECEIQEPSQYQATIRGGALVDAKIVDVDFAEHAIYVVEAPADAVPLPRELVEEPFKQFPMLRWACSVVKRKLGESPFAGLRGIFVLHFLTDLIPFAKACLELGLEPQGSVFFFKAKYQYPHRQGVLQWLRGCGFAVRAIEELSEGIAEIEQSLEANSPRFVIIEDGGYFTPRLHELKSALAGHVIGSVEQTTKGLRLTEDWGCRQTAPLDLDGALRFPLLSIPDSKIKLKVEPPLIGLNIVNCIQALDHSLSLPGMRVGLFGLGTIGLEVYARLRDLGALVTGFDIDASRCLEFRMKGGEVSSTPVQAARGRRLLIGCSGRKSITKDVIANLEHGAYIASGSSDLVEIDREYLDDQMIRSRRLGMGDRDWEPGRLWAGTEYLLPGKPNKQINLLADGYPVTFWGFAGMPHQGGDLIMTVILIAGAELAARNGTASRTGAYPNKICRQAVDDLGQKYEIESQYLRQYLPDVRS